MGVSDVPTDFLWGPLALSLAEENMKFFHRNMRVRTLASATKGGTGSLLAADVSGKVPIGVFFYLAF